MVNYMVCKGCADDGYCTISDKKKIKCPCTICLIKGICIDTCEDYQLFIQLKKEV